jgi:transcriptional regulator with XRE-family HTH domain
MEMSRFAKNLKLLRELRGLKQSQMLKECGFPRSTWNNYEMGNSHPNFTDLLKISQYFDISETDLIHADLPTNVHLIKYVDVPFSTSKSPSKSPPNSPSNQPFQHQNEPENTLVNEPGEHYTTTPTAPSWITGLIESQAATIQSLQTALTQALRRIATLEKNAKK